MSMCRHRLDELMPLSSEGKAAAHHTMRMRKAAAPARLALAMSTRIWQGGGAPGQPATASVCAVCCCACLP